MSKIPDTGASVEYQFTAVPNRVLEKLCRTRITGEDRQVLDAIQRTTYGWKKREAEITLLQFMGMTEMKKPNIVRALRRLEKRGIIIVIIPDNGKVKKYKLNNDLSKWKSLSNTITAESVINPDNKHYHPRLRSLSDSITNIIIPDNDNGGKATTDGTFPTPKEKKEILKKAKESEAPPGLLKGQGPSLQRDIRDTQEKRQRITREEEEERRRFLKGQVAIIQEQEAVEAGGHLNA
jgi:phage replication O-like protein O